MSSERTAGQPLLVVIAPTARRVDGESVRIARDVLCGGAAVKVAVPESPAELDRVLAHRGRKRPVVIGDDRALHLVVQTLHRQRELAADPLGLVPVGGTATVALARALGIPTEPVAAARAVLAGYERSLDLLVDDSGGVVLGGLCIPGRSTAHPGGRDDGAPTAAPRPGTRSAAGRTAGRTGRTEGRTGADRAPHQPRPDGDPTPCSPSAKSPAVEQTATPLPRGTPGPWWSLLTPSGLGRTARTLVRAVRPGALALPGAPGHRLRVEADGTLLADVDHPVRLVTVRLAALDSATADPVQGGVEVLVRPPSADGDTLRVRAQTLTVAGRGFSYEADSELAGPVRTRTWTVRPAAWRLTVPRTGAW